MSRGIKRPANSAGRQEAGSKNLPRRQAGQESRVKGVAWGFTLLELIVVVGLLGIIAVASTNLFFSAIRGGGKVKVNTTVKQNGQFAMNAMEQMIRNALDVNSLCDGGSYDSVEIEARDGEDVIFACLNVGEATGRIASNSARLTSPQVVVDSCSFTCTSDPNNIRGESIKIYFELSQADSEADVFESSSTTFNTSVSLRKY